MRQRAGNYVIDQEESELLESNGQNIISYLQRKIQINDFFFRVHLFIKKIEILINHQNKFKVTFHDLRANTITKKSIRLPSQTAFAHIQRVTGSCAKRKKERSKEQKTKQKELIRMDHSQSKLQVEVGASQPKANEVSRNFMKAIRQKNKALIQTYQSSNNAIKEKALQSFEKQFPCSVGQFDFYIDEQFKKMLEQKTENPSLMIPNGFKKFVHSNLFQNLIRKIYEYMYMLIEYQQKYEKIVKRRLIEQETKAKMCRSSYLSEIKQQSKSLSRSEMKEFRDGEEFSNDSFQKMRHQSHLLEEKCKEISYIYMGILLSYGECKLIFKDQYFFETMIYFISQVLKSTNLVHNVLSKRKEAEKMPKYDSEEDMEEKKFGVIEEELSRIFRTNTFNLIKRRNCEDEINRKYPILKEAVGKSNKYDSSIFGINKMMKRLQIQKKKFNYSMQITDRRKINKTDENSLDRSSSLLENEGLKKPVEIELSTFGSVRSRSPLISTFYPSSKQKLYEFSKNARQRESFVKSRQIKGESHDSFEISQPGQSSHILPRQKYQTKKKNIYGKSMANVDVRNQKESFSKSNTFFYRPQQFERKYNSRYQNK